MRTTPLSIALPIASEPAAAEVRQIVDHGVRRYFADRRQRVGPFVDRNFTLRGSLSLHRAAVGWDIARAPLNLAMAAPQVGLLVASHAARKLGASRLASELGSRRLVVHTSVGKELAWRLHTDLLELPYQSGDRIATKDALAETILSDPRVVAALAPALEAGGARYQRRRSGAAPSAGRCDDRVCAHPSGSD
jgi:hypothetical protein